MMNIDSQIAARIISYYVMSAKPILSVHDSFIVPISDVENLEFTMDKGFGGSRRSKRLYQSSRLLHVSLEGLRKPIQRL